WMSLITAVGTDGCSGARASHEECAWGQKAVAEGSTRPDRGASTEPTAGCPPLKASSGPRCRQMHRLAVAHTISNPPLEALQPRPRREPRYPQPPRQPGPN